MRDRSLLGALLLIGALVPITSCINSPSLTSIVVTPNVMNFGGAGLTTQLTATGYYTHPGHAAITKDITNQVTWASSTTGCVTVSNTGLITSGQDICSNILVSASASGFHGTITGTMTVNVTQPTSGSGGNTIPDVTSITLIPSSATVATIGETVQFVAIGNLSGGGTVDLTSVSTWRSSQISVASVSTTGVATALSAGTTTISAVFTNADGTSASGSGSLTVSPSQTAEPLVGLTILPGAQTVLAVGQTAQFVAIGTTGAGTTVDLTAAANLTWSSSITSVGTIGAHTGLATAVGAGTTAITAIATNPDGTVVTSSSSFNVNISSTSTGEPLLSLAIIPTSQAVGAVGETSQYIAIGTFSSSAAKTTSICNSTGVMQDCTDYVSWSSSDVSVGTISKNGLATAVGTAPVGSTAITAIATNPDGTVVTGEATFSVGPSTISPLQSTLGVTLIGTGAANGLVTAPSPANPGGPLVISCTTVQGSTCTQPFTTGSTVTLTATPSNGAQFGGWSNNCTPTALPINPNGANSCTITMTTNETVAAIFY